MPSGQGQRRKSAPLGSDSCSPNQSSFQKEISNPSQKAQVATHPAPVTSGPVAASHSLPQPRASGRDRRPGPPSPSAVPAPRRDLQSGKATDRQVAPPDSQPAVQRAGRSTDASEGDRQGTPPDGARARFPRSVTDADRTAHTNTSRERAPGRGTTDGRPFSSRTTFNSGTNKQTFVLEISTHTVAMEQKAKAHTRFTHITSANKLGASEKKTQTSESVGT